MILSRYFWTGRNRHLKQAFYTRDKGRTRQNGCLCRYCVGWLSPSDVLVHLEREHFLARLGDTPEKRAVQRRLWIIQIEEMPTAKWQKAFFPDAKGHVFYEKDADGKVRLPPPETDAEADRRFLERVDDLAEAIAARLKDMKLPREKTLSDPLRRVFLAECTTDLESERFKMKLFLKEKGWLISPESNYDDASYEALLERDLKASLAFVQLVGPYPWKKGGFDVRQNEKAKTLNIPRFRRRDPEIEVNTVAEPHRAFISAPDVIAAGFEDFKAYLDGELRALWLAKQPSARPEPDTTPLVYVAVRARTPTRFGMKLVNGSGPEMSWHICSSQKSLSRRNTTLSPATAFSFYAMQRPPLKALSLQGSRSTSAALSR